MRCLALLLSVMVLAACGKDGTGPKGLDPTVLVTNAAGPDTLHLTWFDQSGQVAVFHIAMGTSACVHFTSTLPADSVRFFVIMGDSTPGHQYAYQFSPWFDPATGVGPDSTQYPFGAENWTLTVSTAFGLTLVAVHGPPC